MTLRRLNEIAKEQWYSGSHGHEHLRMSSALHEHLRTHWAPAPGTPEVGREVGKSTMTALSGVPIVLDDSLAAWHWELRDNTSRQLAESGWVYEIELGVVDTTGDSE